MSLTKHRTLHAFNSVVRSLPNPSTDLIGGVPRKHRAQYYSWTQQGLARRQCPTNPCITASHDARLMVQFSSSFHEPDNEGEGVESHVAHTGEAPLHDFVLAG